MKKPPMPYFDASVAAKHVGVQGTTECKGTGCAVAVFGECEPIL
jgi:hypothetical protein